MSHLLHRRRGHDSEYDDDEEEGSVVTEITTDIDDDEDDEDDDDDDDDEGSSTADDDDSEEDESDDNSDKESDEDSDEDSDLGSDDRVINDEQEKEIQDTNATALDKEDQPLATAEIDYQELQQQGKEKTVHELREYRRKLAEDPSFVPYVGLFWGHDNRYREDALTETREAVPHFSTASSFAKKQAHDRNLDPLMYKKWDHSGYDELLRMDEEDERRKREMLESGESQIHHSQPRHNTNGYHNFNGRGSKSRGRGVGGGAGGGRGGRGGGGGGSFHQQQDRPGRFQKRANEEWPQLSTSASPGNTVDQSSSDTPDTSRVNAWGSVDRAKEIEPIVKGEMAAEGWRAPLTIKSSDGWGDPPNNKPNADTQASNTNDSWSNPAKAQEEPLSKNTSDGWGAKPEVNADDSWKAPAAIESLAPATAESSHGRKAETLTLNTPSNSDGWGKPPADKNVSSSNWGTAEFNTEQSTIADGNADQEQINKNQEAATDGWGTAKKDISAMDSSAANEADDWKTSAASQWGAATSGKSDDTQKKEGWNKSRLHKEEIPGEERASSSWASINKAASSDLNKTVYNRSYDNFGSFRRSNYHQQEANHKSKPSSYGKQQKPLKVDRKAAQVTDGNWTAPAPAPALASAPAPTPEAASTNGCGTIDGVAIETSEKSGWAEPSAQPKDNDEKSAEDGWGAKPALEQTNPNASWNATEAPESAKTSGWNDSAASFDQSHSSSSSSVRGGKGGWNNTRSSSSTNWNADKEYSSKKIRNAVHEQQPQQKKSRGYFSTRVGSHAPESINTFEESDSPEASAWGNFQSTGDDDSDVEIILEAEEEPGWIKDEQVLGMTAPGQHHQPSFSPRTASKPYLRHDSGQSSPRPEFSRKTNGRPSNNGSGTKPPRSSFEESWRQQREEPETYHSTYYPAPHHSAPPINGNITYMPMIPTGNGNPMYAMPFPMHSSPSGGSVSPLQLGESSSTSPPPNLQQQHHKYYTPSPPPPPSNVHQLPPGYEANGMVYYGMDPSAMYPPPQPYYYYAPPVNSQPYTDDHHVVGHPSLSPQRHQYYDQAEDEDGWGPTPETVETEEQWATKPPQNDFQHRKSPASQYYYSQQNHHY
ncbi:hypothetical protein BD408DRAFT_417620 [Parasitella parasitica]|nr:hypothetical protein BD408DRAFT_417620 [Parasitella parasitica]